jgi:hypothetical protein
VLHFDHTYYSLPALAPSTTFKLSRNPVAFFLFICLLFFTDIEIEGAGYPLVDHILFNAMKVSPFFSDVLA